MNIRYTYLVGSITITSLLFSYFSYAKLISVEKEEQFRDLITSKKSLILKFSADYCPPCKITKEPFQEVANEPEFSEIEFAEIDVGSSEGNTFAQQFNVLGAPTFVYIRDGNEVDRVVGLENVHTFKEDLRTKLKQNLGLTIAMMEIENKMPPKVEKIKPEEISIEVEEELALPLPDETEIPQPQEARSIMAQIWTSLISFFSFFIEKMQELLMYIIDLIRKLFGR